jgi:hypothetical protein
MFNPSKFTIENGSYVMIYADKIKIGEDSVISGDFAGCNSESPKLDSMIGKYVKVCKVKGGSNIGRGSLGSDVNM